MGLRFCEEHPIISLLVGACPRVLHLAENSGLVVGVRSGDGRSRLAPRARLQALHVLRRFAYFALPILIMRVQFLNVDYIQAERRLRVDKHLALIAALALAQQIDLVHVVFRFEGNHRQGPRLFPHDQRQLAAHGLAFHKITDERDGSITREEN